MLKRALGQHITVVGIYARTGIRRSRRRVYTTVLIRHVCDAKTGAPLAEQLWFNRGNSWRQVRLEPGDRVRFQARVIEYRRGYWGPDPIRRTYDPPRLDYCLTPPHGLTVVSGPPPARRTTRRRCRRQGAEPRPPKSPDVD